MNFEKQTPAPEKESRWLSKEEILNKMGSFVNTRNCGEPKIIERPDGLVTKIEYEFKNLDGSTSVFSYIVAGPRTKNTNINIAHFRGNPDDGEWLGGGGTLSNYDEVTGKWTDVSDIKSML